MSKDCTVRADDMICSIKDDVAPSSLPTGALTTLFAQTYKQTTMITKGTTENKTPAKRGEVARLKKTHCVEEKRTCQEFQENAKSEVCSKPTANTVTIDHTRYANFSPKEDRIVVLSWFARLLTSPGPTRSKNAGSCTMTDAT